MMITQVARKKSMMITQLARKKSLCRLPIFLPHLPYLLTSAYPFQLTLQTNKNLIRDICERSQWSGKVSANSSDGEAHGHRNSPSQQVPKFVTASAKALVLLLFFPQHLHVIYAIRAATTSLRLTAWKRYGVGTSCPNTPRGVAPPACSGAPGPTYFPQAGTTLALRRVS